LRRGFELGVAVIQDAGLIGQSFGLIPVPLVVAVDAIDTLLPAAAEKHFNRLAHHILLIQRR
jgi:hypothetical protein